jgi:O-antigen/teichoic acid export membrane protein
VALAVGGAAAQILVSNQIHTFQAKANFRLVTVVTTASTLLQRVAPLVIAWRWHLSLDGYLGWQAILGLPLVASLVIQSMTSLRHGRIIAWCDFWPESRAFYAAGMVRYAATQIDQPLVALFFTRESLVPYFLLRRLYSAIVVVIGAALDVIIARFGKRSVEGAHAIRTDQARILSRLAAWGALAGSLGAANAKLIVPLLLGPGISAPAPLVPVFIIASLGYGLYSLALAGDLIAGQPKDTLVISVLSAIVPLPCAPLLVPILGVAAFPAAMTLGYLTAAAVAIYPHSCLRRGAQVALAAMIAVGCVGALAASVSTLGPGVPWLVFLLNGLAATVTVAIGRLSGAWRWEAVR